MCQDLLVVEFSRSHSDTPHSVGLPWTNDRPVAETSTSQHTTPTTDRHSCPRRDSNPQSQQVSGHIPTPSTVWPKIRIKIFIRECLKKTQRWLCVTGHIQCLIGGVVTGIRGWGEGGSGAARLKADSHIACRAHAVPLPCWVANGLERVFPIWFTQCGRVWFTLAMPCSDHAVLL